MTERTAAAHPATAPRRVTIFSPIARRLLAAGVPLGFNGLVTITGRTSGQPGRRRSRSSSTKAGAGSGPRGATSTGSATSGPPAGRRSRSAAARRRSPRRSSTAPSARRSSATSWARSPARSPAGRGSSGPSTGSISPTRSRRRRAGPSSSCGPCADVRPPRGGDSGSPAAHHRVGADCGDQNELDEDVLPRGVSTYGDDYDRRLDTTATRALRLIGSGAGLEEFLRTVLPDGSGS